MRAAHGRWVCHRYGCVHWGVTSGNAKWSQMERATPPAPACCADDAAKYGWFWLLMKTMELMITGEQTQTDGGHINGQQQE